ncbi:MAG TPA: hypothetical protein VI299_08705 [Polyangiales bacterium]
MRMPILDPALVSALKKLKLGHLAETLPERLVLANKQDLSFESLMLLVLSDEKRLTHSPVRGMMECDSARCHYPGREEGSG